MFYKQLTQNNIPVNEIASLRTQFNAVFNKVGVTGYSSSENSSLATQALVPYQPLSTRANTYPHCLVLQPTTAGNRMRAPQTEFKPDLTSGNKYVNRSANYLMS